MEVKPDGKPVWEYTHPAGFRGSCRGPGGRLLAVTAGGQILELDRSGKLLRTITTSYVYGLSSLPTERNAADRQNYSRHYRMRLRGEVLLDAVTDIAGVAETFTAMPAGSRANQLWTTRVQSVFLDTFGRPNPNQDPPCERTSDTTVTRPPENRPTRVDVNINREPGSGVKVDVHKNP